MDNRICVDCKIEVAEGTVYCPDCGRFIPKVQPQKAPDEPSVKTYPSLKRSLLIAGGIFFFDAFLANQGLIAIVTGLSAILVFVIKLVISIFKKVEPFWSMMARAAIYVVMAVCVIGANDINNKIARKRADGLIAACHAYKARHDKFPDRLENLVPEFVSKIPRAKYTLMYQDFSYINTGEKGSHHMLYYVSFPPFGRPIYTLEKGTWGYLD